MLNKVAGGKGAVELVSKDAIPAGFTGTGGSGQTEDGGSVGQTRKAAGLDCGGANLIVGELAKQLTKAFNMLVEQWRQGLRCAVAASKAGAAGG